MSAMSRPATRADVCVVACARAWRDQGEVVARPIGTVPTIGARLARNTFAPDIVLSDGEASIVAGVWPLGEAPTGAVEGWMPYRSVFMMAWGGHGHIMMKPSQVDRHGNANLSIVGEHSRPKRQLVGVCGAPGNSVNGPTSYWIPKHSRLSLVEAVDMVCGVGYDRGAGSAAGRFLDLRLVVTNLAVLDFAGPDHTARLASVHPGVSVDEVVSATGFDLAVPDEPVVTPAPTAQELDLIDTIDPHSMRERELSGFRKHSK